jgi:hypothetical protein
MNEKSTGCYHDFVTNLICADPTFGQPSNGITPILAPPWSSKPMHVRQAVPLVQLLLQRLMLKAVIPDGFLARRHIRRT